MQFRFGGHCSSGIVGLQYIYILIYSIFASSPDYGIGYKWNPQLVEIHAGDIVHWTWSVIDYVSGISYTVQQTADADATSYDGSGFYAGSSSTQGRLFNPPFFFCSQLGVFFPMGNSVLLP